MSRKEAEFFMRKIAKHSETFTEHIHLEYKDFVDSFYWMNIVFKMNLLLIIIRLPAYVVFFIIIKCCVSILFSISFDVLKTSRDQPILKYVFMSSSATLIDDLFS